MPQIEIYRILFIALFINNLLVTMMKRITTIVVALLVTAALSGCNTTRGFGQDVQKLGSTISHAAS